MKKIIALSLLACACGDWSNEDIEYLYALPQKDLLKSQLGDMASTGQGVRRDPLLGADAGVYRETKEASDGFNDLVDGVLTGLDTLRSIHPTKREKNKRIWGPYPDEKNPGFDVKAEIVRVTEKRFEWSLQARKRGTETFTTLAGGKFVPTVSLRKGRGDFFFDAKASHELYGTTKKNPTDPDSAVFEYSTDSDPLIVHLGFDVGGTPTVVAYEVNTYADGSGVFAFTADGLPDPNATRISAVAAWDVTTAGEVSYTILEGNYRTAMARSCWDKNQTVVYEWGNWPGAPVAGNPNDCVAVKTLQPLPPTP